MPSNSQPSGWERLAPGLPVRSISGRNLGVIGEVRDGAFRVDFGDDSSQVWLMADALFTIEGDMVSLICERNGVYRFEAG